MSATATQRVESGLSHNAQPNEFDRKRIERALARRKRYRYVSPTVHTTVNGYRIESPCCSRNVDPQGGIVDVALMQFVPGSMPWHLYRMEHSAQQWRLHACYARLPELLEHLNTDPQRLFWQ